MLHMFVTRWAIALLSLSNTCLAVDPHETSQAHLSQQITTLHYMPVYI